MNGEEELEKGPMPIQVLEQNGIQSGDVKKLVDAGIHTIEAVLF